MDFRITADERATFKRCRRRWDFGSGNRRDLERVAAGDNPAGDGQAGDSFASAVKDALAVYYYPGTWDWSREFVLTLVRKAYERSAEGDVGAGVALLELYSEWAPRLDDFAPVRIDHDVRALVPDPRDPERGMLTGDGRRVSYAGRVDLLAVDSADAYWVVRHRIVPEWQDIESMVLDEEAVAACWVWEQEYLGMEIAGTIHNEVSTSIEADPAPATARSGKVRWWGPARAGRRRVAQHEPSGGGRSIPQHRRLYARSAPAATESRVEQREAGPVRRTKIRRSRAEIAAVGRLIGAEALEMINPELATYPTPAEHCRTCQFVAPCLAMTEGADPEPVLAAGYQIRPVRTPKPRPGQSTWSTNRGAAPPPNW